jgi:hypothetical protein
MSVQRAERGEAETVTTVVTHDYRMLLIVFEIP